MSQPSFITPRDKDLNDYVDCLYKVRSRLTTQRRAESLLKLQRLKDRYYFDTEDLKNCNRAKNLKTNYESLKELFNQINGDSQLEIDRRFVYNRGVQKVYHKIETEKLGGSDMFAMIKSLQHYITEDQRYQRTRNIEGLTTRFENRGGIHELETMKGILLEIGVEVYE